MSLTRRSLLRSIASLAPVAILPGCTKRNSPANPVSLSVFCAAGLRKPLEQAASDFHATTSTNVRFQFGGSGALLSQLKVVKTGDLFVAADEETLALAKKLDVIREVFPLALQAPVIAVQKELKTSSVPTCGSR
jgi:molybdate transport system substrate-binding protein